MCSGIHRVVLRRNWKNSFSVQCKEMKADHRQVTGKEADVITNLNFTSIYHYSHRISPQDLQELVCIFVLSLCICIVKLCPVDLADLIKCEDGIKKLDMIDKHFWSDVDANWGTVKI